MPTRAQVLALLDEGQSFEAAGQALGIAPGQAYMIATGLPADGSDTPHPEEVHAQARTAGEHAGSRQSESPQPHPRRDGHRVGQGSGGTRPGARVVTTPGAGRCCASCAARTGWVAARRRSQRALTELGADAHRRPRGQVGLPVLRGRLRAERVRQGRARRPDRGRPRRAAQPRAAVPEGLGDAAADDRRLARASTSSTAAPYAHATGSGSTSRRRWTWSPTESCATRRGMAVGERRRPHAALHEHRRARRRDARQRGELPDQEAPHRRSASSRSRTRRASATARPSSGSAPRSAAAPRARCPATCRTPT